MKKLKEFSIPFSGLKVGKHSFEYQIKNTFFEAFDYDEFNEAEVYAKVKLNKSETMLEFDMHAEGMVNVDCDVTSEPYDQPVAADLNLVVQFGEEFNDENEELLVLPHGEHQINIAQYLYEMLVLAIPTKRVHPGVEDGTLQSEVLEKLKTMQPKVVVETKEDTDPRWDALKGLLTDK